MAATEIAVAQTKPKAKTEQEKYRKRKEKKRKHRRNKQYTVKRKSRFLEKFYFGSKSKQVQRNSGYISLQPKRQSYGGMQANEERNPQVRNLKSFDRQKNNLKYQSRRIQKSYGSEPVFSGNKKMLYKYGAKTAQEYSGTKKYASPKKRFKQDSRKQTRSQGNMILQPKMLQKNYNAEHPGSDRYASRSKMKSQNRKESDYRQSSAQMQKHSGNILISRNASKLNGKYNSKIQQKNRGDLRSKDVKSAAANRASSASMAANYAGEKRIESRTGRKNYEKYLSRRTSTYTGSLKTLTPKQHQQAVVGNSMMMADYSGRQRGDSKSARKSWNKKFSKYNVNYSGNLKAYTKKQKDQAMEGKSLMMADYQGTQKRKSRSARDRWSQKANNYTKYQGGIKTLTQKQRKQAEEGDALMMADYRGDIKTKSRSAKDRWSEKASTYSKYQGDLKTLTPKQRKQAIVGNSMMMADYRGDSKTVSEKRKDKWFKNASKYMGSYSGNLKALTKKQKQQAEEGDAMMLAEYSGTVKGKSEKRTNLESRRKAEMTGKYQGNIVLKSRDYKEKNYEYMSKIAQNYQGELKAKSQKKTQAENERKARTLAEYSGEIVLPSKKYKDLNYEFMSKTAHNYSGDIKVKSQKRALAESERKAKTLAEYSGEIILPSKDYKELNYKFMSKVAHNYEGDLKAMSKNKKDRYYAELSARNQQIIGNYRLKYKFVKDLEDQITSARVHNYEGGPKTGLVTRIWLKIFDNGDRLKKADNTVKKPKYDTREAEIWY